jgi:hypothetical protein
MRGELSPEVANETCAELPVTEPFPPAVYSPTQELAQAVSADERRKRDELPAKPDRYTQRNRYKHRQMHREKPLQGELARVRSPIPERQI